jgi:hypothetical protein
LAEKLKSDSLSYEDTCAIVKLFDKLTQNVTHGNVSFSVLASVNIDGRALNAGLKQHAPKFVFERELMKTQFFNEPVKIDDETAKKRSPQEYFHKEHLGFGTLQMSALFLDPKNRRLLLRPIQPPDKMVMNVLRKFHGVMLESFEPSGDLVLLMRLVQAQQQFLCKFVKMILKALGTRPDAFSWVSQALLEIENVSSGRTFDKKIVPTLLEMYAASQGISLSSGQHAWDTLVVNFPIDLTQADFEIFGNFAGEPLSILDGFEKCFSSVELGARNATAAFGHLPGVAQAIAVLAPLKFVASITQSTKILNAEGRTVGPCVDWNNYLGRLKTAPSPLTMEKIGEEGRSNTSLLLPIDPSSGSYGFAGASLTLTAGSKTPPKKNYAAPAATGAARSTAGIKIMPPMRAPAAQSGNKKMVSTPQSLHAKAPPVPPKQTSFSKPAAQDARETRNEMTLDEARIIAVKFLKDQGIAQKTVAIFGNGTEKAIYFKHYKNRDGEKTLMYVNEDVMKHADSRQKRAIYLLKDKSREVHGIQAKSTKARVHLLSGEDDEEDTLELEFFDLGDGSDTGMPEEQEEDERLMLSQGDLVELGPPEIDRRVWNPPSQDFRSLQPRQSPSYRQDQHQRDDYTMQEGFHSQALKAREDFIRAKQKMMQTEHRDQAASAYMARGSTDFEQGPPRTPWARGNGDGGGGGDSWLNQSPNIDTSSEPGWEPEVEEEKLKSGRRRKVAEEADDAASTSSHY